MFEFVLPIQVYPRLVMGSRLGVEYRLGSSQPPIETLKWEHRLFPNGLGSDLQFLLPWLLAW